MAVADSLQASSFASSFVDISNGSHNNPSVPFKRLLEKHSFPASRASEAYIFKHQ